MTNEHLLIELYERLAAEQAQYQEWLLGQPPGEILNHAYEYSVREDMVMAMEDLELSDAQAKALLKSRNPLADLYDAWAKVETRHMDDIRDVIEHRCNDLIRSEKEKGQRDRSR